MYVLVCVKYMRALEDKYTTGVFAKETSTNHQPLLQKKQKKQKKPQEAQETRKSTKCEIR